MKIVLTTIILSITCVSNATTYFISSLSGSNNNSGVSPEFPWKSIDKVNNQTFIPGDSILFKRGEIWREQLFPSSGNASSTIYYGAYGVGEKPCLLGSLNYSNNDDWNNLGGNLWECIDTFSTDIGNIIFDQANSVGFKKWNQNELQNQDDFFYNLNSGRVLIYSTINPGSLHSEIELAIRNHIINQTNVSYTSFENLCLKYGAAHGFGGGNTAHLTISKCDISYIGGGDLEMDGKRRFGNGIEFWGEAKHNKVERCKIWEIYDTGLSNQNHTLIKNQHNITYRNNIIWNCGLASFEYWNRPKDSKTYEIYFENNTCLYAGSGWGQQRPDLSGFHVLIDSNPAETDTIYIRNNIFHYAQRAIYATEDNINGFIKLDYNLINQTLASDTLFASFPSINIFKFSDFTNYTSTVGKDKNSITGDPQFEDESSFNFELNSASPCINMGTIVNLKDDFEGNNRPESGFYDIGAYEYSLPQNINSKNLKVELKVFPNPVQNEFKIILENTFENLTLNLYNSQGQIVKTINNYRSNNNMDIQFLANGVYYIQVINKSNIRFVKQIQILR